MTPFLIALLIFGLRIVDVSIGTIRTIYTVRGQRTVAASLGFVEALIWIYAISRLMVSINESPLTMIAWAVGFATGTVVGITVEGWIASGSILVRCISRNHAVRLRELLNHEGFGVTAVQGQGRDGNVLVIFVVTQRKRGPELLAKIDSIDPEAFVTVEPVSKAIGGWTPNLVPAAGMRK